MIGFVWVIWNISTDKWHGNLVNGTLQTLASLVHLLKQEENARKTRKGWFRVNIRSHHIVTVTVFVEFAFFVFTLFHQR